MRRKFATELKFTPLRDLAHLGGWRTAQTILKCYQQPDNTTLRAALATRGRLLAPGLVATERTPPTDTTPESGAENKTPAIA